MGFMSHEITGKEKWFSVDGSEGTYFFPADCFDKKGAEKNYPGKLEGNKAVTVWGYGARLSASGYLDCTDWVVFSSRKKAREYLEENYPEGGE